jgi:hypothetical protein
VRRRGDEQASPVGGPGLADAAGDLGSQQRAVALDEGQIRGDDQLRGGQALANRLPSASPKSQLKTAEDSA